MKPVRSLSKTWKPRQYSSGSPGSRKPPGRLRTRVKESKSTVHLTVSALFLAVVKGWWGGGGLTVAADLALEVADLGLGGVLAAGAQQVAERVELHAPRAALVEEGEGLLEVGALCLVAHRAPVSLGSCGFCSWMW